MPLTIFDWAAVKNAGRSFTEPYGLGSRHPFRGGVQVLITGRHGFERTVRFSIDEDPAMIRECVRETLEAE